MANYQNSMRYSRMGAMYSQQRQNYNNMMGRDTCSRASEMREEQQCENCYERQNNEERCYEESCEEHGDDILSGMPLAMAYVPWQKWQNIYETCKGFHRGTIFAELDKPFLGRGGCNR